MLFGKKYSIWYLVFVRNHWICIISTKMRQSNSLLQKNYATLVLYNTALCELHFFFFLKRSSFGGSWKKYSIWYLVFIRNQWICTIIARMIYCRKRCTTRQCILIKAPISCTHSHSTPLTTQVYKKPNYNRSELEFAQINMHFTPGYLTSLDYYRHSSCIPVCLWAVVYSSQTY